MSSSSKYMRFSLSRRGGFIRRTGRTIGIRAVPQRLYEKIVGELFPGRIDWRPETARNKIFSAVRISLLSNSKTRKRGTNLSRDSFGSVISKLGIFTFSECEVLNLYLVIAASFYFQLYWKTYYQLYWNGFTGMHDLVRQTALTFLIWVAFSLSRLVLNLWEHLISTTLQTTRPNSP